MALADNTQALIAGFQLGNQLGANINRAIDSRRDSQYRTKAGQDRLKEGFGEDTVYGADGNVDIVGSAAKRRVREEAARLARAQGTINAYGEPIQAPAALGRRPEVDYAIPEDQAPTPFEAPPAAARPVVPTNPYEAEGMAAAMPQIEASRRVESQRLMQERRYDEDRVIRDFNAKSADTYRKDQIKAQKAAGLRNEMQALSRSEDRKTEIDMVTQRQKDLEEIKAVNRAAASGDNSEIVEIQGVPAIKRGDKWYPLSEAAAGLYRRFKATQSAPSSTKPTAAGSSTNTFRTLPSGLKYRPVLEKP